MLFKYSQLVCSVFVLSITPFTYGQATSTGSNNGIVSAAGGPAASQTVSYSIIGQGLVEPSSIASAMTTVPYTSGRTSSTASSDNAVMNGSNLTQSGDHGLSTPAIVGIVAAVTLALALIIMVTIITYKKRQLAIGRAKRKTIMDAEFAASEPYLPRRPETSGVDRAGQVGYFDIAKPLPAVISKGSIEDDRLSRSSTIIADAAEIAQINRKASSHQSRHKKSRDQTRERNQALQILITNADNRTSVLRSPLSSNPTTPVESDSVESPRDKCPDGDGDAFAFRASKV